MEAKKKFVINAAFYGIILALIVASYKYILPILTPFIVGFCVASGVRFLLRKLPPKIRKYDRPVSILLCIAVYVTVIWVIVLVGSLAVSQISSFASSVPELFDTYLYPSFLQISQQLKLMLAPIDANWVDWLMELGKTAVQSIGQFVTDLSAGAVKLVANGAIEIPNLLIQIVLTIVSTFYISADYRRVLRFLKNLIPQSKRSLTIHTLRYAETAVLAYIKSYFILFLLTFLELSVGLLILRIPYSGLVALGIALFDLMPVLGTGGILLPWTVILLFMGNYPLAIGIALLYVIIAIVRNAVEPRIVGNQIGLHPLATLVAMIVGLRLIGLIGMLCFPVGLVAVMNLKKSAQEAEASQESEPAQETV